MGQSLSACSEDDDPMNDFCNALYSEPLTYSRVNFHELIRKLGSTKSQQRQVPHSLLSLSTTNASALCPRSPLAEVLDFDLTMKDIDELIDAEDEQLQIEKTTTVEIASAKPAKEVIHRTAVAPLASKKEVSTHRLIIPLALKKELFQRFRLAHTYNNLTVSTKPCVGVDFPWWIAEFSIPIIIKISCTNPPFTCRLAPLKPPKPSKDVVLYKPPHYFQSISQDSQALLLLQSALGNISCLPKTGFSELLPLSATATLTGTIVSTIMIRVDSISKSPCPRAHKNEIPTPPGLQKCQLPLSPSLLRLLPPPLILSPLGFTSPPQMAPSLPPGLLPPCQHPPPAATPLCQVVLLPPGLSLPPQMTPSLPPGLLPPCQQQPPCPNSRSDTSPPTTLPICPLELRAQREVASALKHSAHMFGGDKEYTIEAMMGYGANGVAVAAMSLGTGKPVAIKIINKNGDGAVWGVRLDTACASRMGRILGTCARCCMTCGMSHAGRGHQGMLPVAMIRALFKQCVEGVLAMHGLGFSHGDVKPENFLVRTVGSGLELVLTDMGNIHFPGEVMARYGTPNFSAPEFLAGFVGVRDGRAADVFALGVMLCRLFGVAGVFQASMDHMAFGNLNYQTVVRAGGGGGDFPLNTGGSTVFPTSLVQGMLKIDPRARISIQDVVNDAFCL
ncbi:kinase-like domain-containing protein [Obelidium mucronatum]|nr:kinase-like domain-containing protein [Obelidium mucronatum]